MPGLAPTGGSAVTAGAAAPPPAALTVSLDGGMPLKYDDRLCVTCHNKLVDRKSRHSQLKDGNCWDCHLPASRASECQGIGVGSTKTVEKNRTGSFSMEVSVVGWRLKESEPKLCQRCHEGIATDGEIHGAISKGGCAVCHDPHSSDLKKELKAPPEKLCATCHRRDDKKFRHMLDGHTLRLCEFMGALANAFAQRVCKRFGVIEYFDVARIEEAAHTLRITGTRQGAGDNDTVVAGKHAQQVRLITFSQQFHDQRSLKRWTTRILTFLVPACPA